MSSIRKGFRMVEIIVGAGSDGLSFSRIVEQAAVPKASAHRLLAELVDLSVLTLDPATRCYRGGLLLARLGASVMTNYDLRTAARPHLQALHDEFGYVVTLGIRNQDSGIYVDKIEAADFGIRLHSEVGKAFPLHCTAMGKILLSHAESSTIRRLTNRKLDTYTPNTITDAKKLRTELQQIRKQGYAIDDEEITRGLVCVAAPIFGVDGSIAGAMSCTFPSYIRTEGDIQPVVEAVRRAASLASM